MQTTVNLSGLNINKRKNLVSFFFWLILLSLFLFCLVSLIIPSKKIQINSVSPAPNSLSLSLINPITIIFNKELSPQEKEKLNIEIAPFLEVSQQWINDKTLNLTPRFVFEEETTYKISILFNQKSIYGWSFTTPKLDRVAPEEIAKIQGYFDPAGEAMRKAYEERPWLASLPIQTKNYSIDYLDSKKAIRVLMKIDVASPLSREEQITKIKKEVPEKLKEIGVDINKEKIYYTFSTKE